jgi:hypothetical protein
MNKSDFKKLKASFHAMQLTPRRGVLDAEKKILVLQLTGSGLSRREAAQFVECAHTTIGRTAARDPEFAAALRQAESISRLQIVAAIRQAAQDPKYWRAAAWMLERRSPEEYAKRDPNSYTADQVISLLARLYNQTLSLLPAEKVEQFQEMLDEALEEIEAKSGPSERDDDDAAENAPRRTHLAGRDGIAGRNGHMTGQNGEASVKDAAPSANPSSNGHHGRLAKVAGIRVPTSREDVPFAAEQSPAQSHERIESTTALPPGGGTQAQQTPPATTRRAGRAATRGHGIRRFDPAQLHQPHHQGVGTKRESDDRKPLSDNTLQHESTNCTSPNEFEGRCNSDVVQELATCGA